MELIADEELFFAKWFHLSDKYPLPDASTTSLLCGEVSVERSSSTTPEELKPVVDEIFRINSSEPIVKMVCNKVLPDTLSAPAIIAQTRLYHQFFDIPDTVEITYSGHGRTIWHATDLSPIRLSLLLMCIECDRLNGYISIRSKLDVKPVVVADGVPLPGDCVADEWKFAINSDSPIRVTVEGSFDIVDCKPGDTYCSFKSDIFAIRNNKVPGNELHYHCVPHGDDEDVRDYVNMVVDRNGQVLGGSKVIKW